MNYVMLNLYFPAAAPEPHFQPGCGRCIFDFATICKKKQVIFFFFLIACQRGVVSKVRSTSNTTARLPDDLSFLLLVYIYFPWGRIMICFLFLGILVRVLSLTPTHLFFFTAPVLRSLQLPGKNTAPALRKLLLHKYIIATQICFPLDDLMVHDSITFILQNYLMILGLFIAVCQLVGCCTTLLETELVCVRNKSKSREFYRVSFGDLCLLSTGLLE